MGNDQKQNLLICYQAQIILLIALVLTTVEVKSSRLIKLTGFKEEKFIFSNRIQQQN